MCYARRNICIFTCNTILLQESVAVDFSNDAVVGGRNIVPGCDVNAIIAIFWALLFYLHLFILSPPLHRVSVSERIISGQSIWRMHVVLQVHTFCRVECGYCTIDTNVNKWKTIYVPEQNAGYLKNVNYLSIPALP